jgi:hypothetical protein
MALQTRTSSISGRVLTRVVRTSGERETCWGGVHRLLHRCRAVVVPCRRRELRRPQARGWRLRLDRHRPYRAGGVRGPGAPRSASYTLAAAAFLDAEGASHLIRGRATAAWSWAPRRTCGRPSAWPASLARARPLCRCPRPASRSPRTKRTSAIRWGAATGSVTANHDVLGSASVRGRRPRGRRDRGHVSHTVSVHPMGPDQVVARSRRRGWESVSVPGGPWAAPHAVNRRRAPAAATAAPGRGRGHRGPRRGSPGRCGPAAGATWRS